MGNIIDHVSKGVNTNDYLFEGLMDRHVQEIKETWRSRKSRKEGQDEQEEVMGRNWKRKDRILGMWAFSISSDIFVRTCRRLGSNVFFTNPRPRVERPRVEQPSMITSSDAGLSVIASHARSTDSEEPSA